LHNVDSQFLKKSGVYPKALTNFTDLQTDYLPEALDFFEKTIYEKYFDTNCLLLSDKEEEDWLKAESEQRKLIQSSKMLYDIPKFVT